MVVQFTEMHRNGLNWLRVTVKQEFYFGQGTFGTHEGKCQVGRCEPGALLKVSYVSARTVHRASRVEQYRLCVSRRASLAQIWKPLAYRWY